MLQMLSMQRPIKAPIRIRECTGWSEFVLFLKLETEKSVPLYENYISIGVSFVNRKANSLLIYVDR